MIFCKQSRSRKQFWEEHIAHPRFNSSGHKALELQETLYFLRTRVQSPEQSLGLEKPG